MSTSNGTSPTRSRGFGIFFLFLAGLTLLFLQGVGGDQARFGLNEFGAGATIVVLPDLVLPVVPTIVLIAVVSAFAGGIQLVPGFGARTYLVLGIVVILFLFAFLTWATAGQSLNLLSILNLTIRAAVPLTFGALAGVLCERAGVMNIAIEAQFLTAAFTGALVSSVFSNVWLGLLAGALGGAFIGSLLAVMSIKYHTDQIIVGVVLIVFATGLTSFLATQVMTPNPGLNTPAVVRPVAIPGLSEIPILGPLLFNQTIFVYGAVAAVALSHWALFRTRWGLRVRAVGEHPRADTVGVSPYRMRYQAVILGGFVAGIGGAFFTLDSAAQFSEGMSAGLGFIALAAMIVGRWRPLGALGAALVFGFAGSLSSGLSIVQVPIPSEFLLMAPYVATILVVAGLVGRPRPPAADGTPYIKE